MAVCKFFLQGNCRFGDNCRFEHPRSGGGSSFGGGNRFAPLQNNGNRFGGSEATSKPSQWTIDTPQVEQMRLELGKERPKWVLTTYGAVKNTPGSLFEGNEYSAEEIRLRFYELASKGQEAQADQEASQLWSKAESDMNNALEHVNDIRKFMEDCEKKHPNRYDFLNFDGTKTRDDHAKAVEASQNSANPSGFGAGTGFGQPSAPASNPFSRPAAATFGQPTGPSAFGNNAFGKPAASSGFGQSGFGNPTPANAFGQPTAASAFGKPAFGSSGFGQTAQPAQTATAFGQPAQSSGFGATGFGTSASPFGQPAQPAPAFGQPAQPNTGFGKPAFGQTGFGQPGFGQPASAFGQPSQPGGFGQTGFGQTAQPSTTSAFGALNNTGPAFGSNTGSNGFGQQAQSATNAAPEVSMDSDTPVVSQPSQTAQPISTNPFGSNTNSSNPFGMQTTNTQAQPTPSNSVAAAPAPVTSTNSSQQPHPLTGKPSAPLVYTQTLPAGPTQSNMAKQLSTYRGQPVQYLPDTSTVNPEGTTVPCYNRPDKQGAEKIWFPEGNAAPEVVSLNREEKLIDVQAPASLYTDDIRNSYRVLFETGRFEAGKMPSIPPMREWTAYDF